MSKRGAANYMTDQNWDQEEEQEEAGVFSQANKEVLGTRKMMKARRRGVGEDDNSGGGSGANIFKGFTGFSKTPLSGGPAAAFGSLGGQTNGSLSSSSKKTATEEKTTEDSKDTAKSITTSTLSKPSEQQIATKSPSSSRSKYLNQLKALNEGVTKWIREHVEKNSFCILTPIFRDYEKYLADIEKQYPQFSKDDDSATSSVLSKGDDESDSSKTSPVVAGSKSSSGDDSSSLSVTPSPPPQPFTFGSSSAATGAGTMSTGLFSSGAKPTSPPSAGFFSSKSPTTSATTTAPASTKPLGASTASTSLFSSTTTTAATAPTFSGFSFASKTSSVFNSGATTGGFSFASVKTDQKPEGGGTTTTGDEEEYVPPKADVTEVSEEDAIYSKRCKLFFKKDDQWKEKGVGNLHLKPCGEKTQLLIRADTNLGNILLNIMLGSSLPISRQGKNNVTVVCVPNPPLEKEESKMTPMLIRVKTAEDADQLFAKLEELKR